MRRDLVGQDAQPRGLLLLLLLALSAPHAETRSLRRPQLSLLSRPRVTARRELAALRLELLRLRGGQEAAASPKGEEEEEEETSGQTVAAGAAGRKPGLLGRLLASAPVRYFRSSPPITRSFVSVSVLLTILASQRLVDLRSIAFSEREVLRRGQWWRMLLNFFYMGEQPLSVFYWMQIYHLWECMRVLELVKFAWDPAAFVKMILLSIAYLLVLKQMAPALMFLGTPLVMVSTK